jgi:hypothetical protein
VFRLKLKFISDDDMSRLSSKDFDELIELLSVSRKLGYFTQSSPLQVLLANMIDSIIQISTFFYSGGLFDEKSNPDLQFLEDIWDEHDEEFKYVSDGLGNPLQKKTFTPRRHLESSKFLGSWFFTLAELMVKMKASKGRLSVMERLARDFRPSSPKKLTKPEFFYHKRRRKPSKES